MTLMPSRLRQLHDEMMEQHIAAASDPKATFI